MSEPNKRPCSDCGRDMVIRGRGLCSGCYTRAWRAGRNLQVRVRLPSQRCAECDGPIDPDKRSGAVFCGRSCKHRSAARKRKRGEENQQVLVIAPRRGDNPRQLQFVYCMQPTRTEIQAQMARKRCRSCGGTLAGKSRGSVFCSKQCLNDGKYKTADPETRRQVRASRAAHYRKVRDQRLLAAKRYAAKHRVERRLTENARRARMLANADSVPVTKRDWERLVRRYYGLCAYCSERPAQQMDHVVPIVRGGRDGIGNVLPACQTCNASKSRRFVMEWKRDQARRSRAA